MSAQTLDTLAFAPARRPFVPAQRPAHTPVPALRLVGPDERASSAASLRARRGVQLTTRGRVAVLAVAAVLLCAVAAAVFAVIAAPAAGSARPPVGGHASVVVQPGDTLWAIAGRVAPKADPRVTVERIIDVNRLTGTGDITAGEVLALPARA